MNYDEINNKLKQISAEDTVWIIYIGIIILSFYSNNLERKYFLYNDLESREKYRKTLILIFTILIMVYLYFLKGSIDDIRNLSPYDSEKKIRLTYLSFIASLFITISGFILLYIALMDESIDVEIAFN